MSMSTEIRGKNMFASTEKSIKATKFEIFKYGFGGLGVTMSYRMITAFFMFFLTDVAGISAGIAGTILLVVNIFDAVNDLAIGSIVDRTNTKWGRYTPVLNIGAPVLVMVLFFLFHVPSFSGTGRIVYYFIMFALYSMAFTTVQVPYQALTATMSEDSSQRNLIVMSRTFLGVAGTTVIMFFTMDLVNFFGNDAIAWRKMILTFGIPMIASMWICASGGKRLDKASVNKVIKKVSFKDQFKAFAANKALLLLGIAFGANMLLIVLDAIGTMYLAKYVVGDISLVKKLGLIALPINVILVPIIPMLLKKFGRKQMFVSGLLLYTIRPIAFLLFKPYSNITVVLGLSIIATAALILNNFTVWTMVADCVDYGEWKTGLKSAGLVSSGVTFIQKFCASFGGVLVGFLLETAGYVGGQPVTPQVINMIISLYTIIPMLLVGAALITMKFYPISTEFYKNMMEDIRMRRQQASS